MKNKFIIGSEWLYLKFYIARSFSDKILTAEIYSVIKQLEKEQHISKYFFIRYSDPYYHIRVRLLLNNLDDYSMIINTLFKKLKKFVLNDIIWKIQADTYEREVERYNEHLIEETESLFHIDSKFSLEILKFIEGSDNENLKWMTAIISIHSYLNLFLNDDTERLGLIRNMDNSFKKEYYFNNENSKILNKLYREKRSTVENLIENPFWNNEMRKIHSLINKRDTMLKVLLNDIKGNSKKHNIDFSIYVASYIHMNINRLIPENNRVHELLLYNYLTRYYESKIAKAKYLTHI